MKIYNLLNMGKFGTLLATAVGGLALAGCEASAENPRDNTNEAVRVASMSVIDRAKTQADCLKLGLETDTQIVSCMTEVGERILQASKDEIAAKTGQRQANATDNAAIDKSIETEKDTGQQLDTTIEVLSKEAEAAEKQLAARILAPNGN